MAQSKDILKKPDALYDKFFRKPDNYKEDTHYCPGCGHLLKRKCPSYCKICERIHESLLLINVKPQI